ncbi:MAG: hypothetical protein ACQEUM_05660 [Pseudomonadota bacterium]
MTPSTAHLSSLDLVEAQARLDALPGSIDNFFDKMTWQFEDQYRGVITINFDDLLDIRSKHTDWPLADTVDWVILTKRIWLALASMSPPSAYLNRASGLKLLWKAMAHYKLTQITRENCSDVINFLLMHGWRKGSAFQNIYIKSYPNFISQVQFKAWKMTFEDIGLKWIARNVTDSFFQKILKHLVTDLTDHELTLKDWYQGGNFNFLTLDYGRYYVEHCLEFFEKNYPMALALASTFKAAPSLSSTCGYQQRTVTSVLSMILKGHSLETIKNRWPSWSMTTLRNIHEWATHHFEESYKQAKFEAYLIKTSTLKNLVVAFGATPSLENIDSMRVILWDWLVRKDKQETQSLLNEYHKVSWAEFKNNLDVIKERYDQQPFLLPTEEDYKALGLIEGDIRNVQLSYPRQLIHLVSKAGLTSIVAMTGWRGSELGFPRSAIKRIKNNDKLDQHAFPWRYQVNWYVYKTSGQVLQLREVSFSIFFIAERIQSLIGATDDQPCLYSLKGKKQTPNASRQIVEKGVRALWRHFVSHYPGFKLLDDWTQWQALNQVRNAGIPLSNYQQIEFKRLLLQRSNTEWGNLAIEANLKEAWRRAREEWPRLELFLTGSNTLDKRDWLVRYRDGNLRDDWITLLDTHLSGTTKKWIHTLPQHELRSSITSRTVINNLIEGTLYPSPHAFRHMWAEAVYRRFDGDAGWMIRSQFKHISKSMWLAYIRDKDNRLGNERAKSQVISSLVHNYLSHHGEGYAGQLHTWLRRLFKQTSVLSPQEQEQLAKRLATVEIENIKSNPWGYCLLKRRTRDKAKCAEMGEPMRYNASPDLCLGCIHNLMQTENVEWALFHVACHVEALKNPVVPAIFKTASYELVKNVTRHVRTLNPQHEALTELQEVLDHYKASRAA